MRWDPGIFGGAKPSTKQHFVNAILEKKNGYGKDIPYSKIMAIKKCSKHNIKRVWNLHSGAILGSLLCVYGLVRWNPGILGGAKPSTKQHFVNVIIAKTIMEETYHMQRVLLPKSAAQKGKRLQKLHSGVLYLLLPAGWQVSKASTCSRNMVSKSKTSILERIWAVCCVLMNWSDRIRGFSEEQNLRQHSISWMLLL